MSLKKARNLLYQRRFQVQKVAGNVLLRLSKTARKSSYARKHNLRLNRLEMLQPPDSITVSVFSNRMAERSRRRKTDEARYNGYCNPDYYGDSRVSYNRICHKALRYLNQILRLVLKVRRTRV